MGGLFAESKPKLNSPRSYIDLPFVQVEFEVIVGVEIVAMLNLDGAELEVA